MPNIDNIGEFGAQGEVSFIKIADSEIPENLEPVKTENGLYILGHSETGHHHAVKEREDIKLQAGTDELSKKMGLMYLTIEKDPATLEHLREAHTHGAWNLSPGTYKVFATRESDTTLQGWRRAAD